jgi:hypothetical protein
MIVKLCKPGIVVSFIGTVSRLVTPIVDSSDGRTAARSAQKGQRSTVCLPTPTFDLPRMATTATPPNSQLHNNQHDNQCDNQRTFSSNFNDATANKFF